MLARILLAIVAVLVTFSLATAEMYKWVDKNGVVTFKDTPPPASKKRKKVKVYTDSDFDAAPTNQPPQSKTGKKSSAGSSQSTTSQSTRFNGTVEIYMTSWCGYCKQALDYMKAKNISYVAYDIEKDSAANQRHKELGGRGVPLIVVGSHKMSGWSPQALESYLGNSRQ